MYIVQEESANKVIKKLRQRKMRYQVTHIVVCKRATITKANIWQPVTYRDQFSQ